MRRVRRLTLATTFHLVVYGLLWLTEMYGSNRVVGILATYCCLILLLVFIIIFLICLCTVINEWTFIHYYFLSLTSTTFLFYFIFINFILLQHYSIIIQCWFQDQLWWLGHVIVVFNSSSQLVSSPSSGWVCPQLILWEKSSSSATSSFHLSDVFPPLIHSLFILVLFSTLGK